MDLARREEAINWLTKAAQDILAAEILTGSSKNLGESLVFHAQQAVEKALKGFLAAHGEPFAKAKTTPDLLGLCAAFNPSFAGVSVAEVSQPAAALSQAKRLYELARANLPEGIRDAI